MSKKKLLDNPVLDNTLKSELLKTKSNNFDFNIEEEVINTPVESEVKTIKEKVETKKVKEVKEEDITNNKEEVKIAKTYRLPSKLVKDIDKILYINRDLQHNATTLIINALEKYISSEENQEYIKEYNKLKEKRK